MASTPDPADRQIVHHPWLPSLDPPLSGGTQAGAWQGQVPNALGTIADRLVYEVQLDARIHSLPTPWSRAEQFAQAVRSSRYPNREALLDELLGCLAAMALWKMVGHRLEAERLDLLALKGVPDQAVGPFAACLHRSLPTCDVLCRGGEGLSPWESLYVLRLNGSPIGLTSPSTLVCPAVELAQPIRGMAWTEGGRFQRPSREHLSPSQREALSGWLITLSEELLRSPNLSSQGLANQLDRVLRDFAQALHDGARPSAVARHEPCVPDLPPRRMPEGLLSRPVQVEERRGRATLKLDERRRRPLAETPTRPVVLVDPRMPEKLGIPATELTLHGAITMAALGGDPDVLRTQHGDAIEVLTPEDIFLPELYLLPGRQALPCSWITARMEGQPSVSGLTCTPLLPFKERIRALYSSAELEQACSLRVRERGGSAQIEVTLLLSLDGQREAYPLSRTYTIRENNLLTDKDLPVIALWPYVNDRNWNAFHIFCEDRPMGLRVDGFSDYQRHVGQERDESLCYFTAERFPDLIKLIDRDRACGLIPITPPPPRGEGVASWSVGIDFGTSFTNFFIDDGGSPGRRSLETLVKCILQAEDDKIEILLRNYFLPRQFLPLGNNPPTATALSLRGWQEVEGSVPELFHEARLWMPTSDFFGGRDVRTGFKWEHPQYQRPFLRELALLIAANAAAVGVESIQWFVSYPSAFSSEEKRDYEHLWDGLCEDLIRRSGLAHSLGTGADGSSLQTESIAFASYFGNVRDLPLVHTACLDIGGGTTDISLWQDDRLCHQASIPFAGREICTRILSASPSFVKRLFSSEGALPLVRELQDDKDLARQDRNLIGRLDNILRFGSGKLLDERLPVLRQSNSPQLEAFISLMAVAMGGLYHYLGLILAALEREGKLLRSEPMPVYAGGNGARLLHWLVRSGAFSHGSEADQLLGTLQRMASGLADVKASTTLSEAFKDETAKGLISRRRRLTGEFDPLADPMIAGEAMAINGRRFDVLDRVALQDLDEEIASYNVSGTEEIRRFATHYDAAIRQGRITTLLPFTKLAEGGDTSLWRDVETTMRSHCLLREGLAAASLQPEPGFITGLKALLEVLTQRWAERY